MILSILNAGSGPKRRSSEVSIASSSPKYAIGILAAWNQQHHPETYEPMPGRPYEPVAITAYESVAVVEFSWACPIRP